MAGLRRRWSRSDEWNIYRFFWLVFGTGTSQNGTGRTCSVLTRLCLVRGRCNQIGQEFLADGRAPAGHGVPTNAGAITVDIDIPLNKRIIPAGDIAEISCCFARYRDFVQGGIDKTQWMASHLIGNGDNACPGWRGGAGSADLLPLSLRCRPPWR